MDNQSNSLDGIVNKVYSKEIQQKRAKKEIRSLKDLDSTSFKVSLQTTSQGLRILVEVCQSAVLNECPDYKRVTLPVMFDMLMDQNFPFNAPKVRAKTNFFKPSVADGRDFVLDIIQKPWNPAILLKDIVNMLPTFIKKLEDLPTAEESQLLGEYHLGMVYNLTDYNELQGARVFQGEEITSPGQRAAPEERIFVLVESFFLSFEPADKVKNTVKLMAWAHVQSIANIKKSKDDNRRLAITWIDNTRESGFVEHIYLLNDAKELLELAVQAGQKYGVKVEKELVKKSSSPGEGRNKKEKDIKLEEVTIKNYKDMRIEELLDNIAFLESKLDVEITLDIVNLLMNLYQKAIEYYSAFNDPNYQEFMFKLTGLLQREDVQLVLQSHEEEKMRQEKLFDNKGQADDDDEEEKKEDDRHASPKREQTSSPLKSPASAGGMNGSGSDTRSPIKLQEANKEEKAHSPNNPNQNGNIESLDM